MYKSKQHQGKKVLYTVSTIFSPHVLYSRFHPNPSLLTTFPQAVSPHIMRPGPIAGHQPQSNDTVKKCLEIYLHSSLCLWLSTTTRKRRALREVAL